jgi:putative endonuclease
MKNLIGKWGEDIIRQWLMNQGYEILHSRWHCRYAEIDIIAQIPQSSTLIFIEVKTRSINNWDENGILAINEKKQQKLRLAGEIFLSQYPAFSLWNCRFDIALLIHHKVISLNSENNLIVPTQLNQIINYQGYQFRIVDYIENAF